MSTCNKNFSFFFKFSIPEKITLQPSIYIIKKIIIWANILPNIKVTLFGRINVGSASIKIKTIEK